MGLPFQKPVIMTTRNVEEVRKLLDKGANPNGEGVFTPLHDAALFGHFDVLRLLIERGADVDRWVAGHTVLECARICGEPEAVAFIEEHIRRKNLNPLLKAINEGDVDAARKLLDDAFWQDITVELPWEKTLLPAVRRGDRKMVKFLINRGATMTPEDVENMRVQEKGEAINLLRSCGLALPRAAKKPETVKVLPDPEPEPPEILSSSFNLTAGDKHEDGSIYLGFHEKAHWFVAAEDATDKKGKRLQVPFHEAVKHVKQCRVHGRHNWEIPNDTIFGRIFALRNSGHFQGSFLTRVSALYWTSSIDDGKADRALVAHFAPDAKQYPVWERHERRFPLYVRYVRKVKP